MTVTFKIMYWNTERLKAAEERGEPIDKTDWTEYGTYETGREAADKVAYLKDIHPSETFTIVRHDPTAGEADWRSRELQRFADGTYKKLEGRYYGRKAPPKPDETKPKENE